MFYCKEHHNDFDMAHLKENRKILDAISFKVKYCYGKIENVGLRQSMAI